MRSRVTDAAGIPRRWWRNGASDPHEAAFREQMPIEEAPGRYYNPETGARCVVEGDHFVWTVPVTIDFQGWQQIEGRPMLVGEVYEGWSEVE